MPLMLWGSSSGLQPPHHPALATYYSELELLEADATGKDVKTREHSEAECCSAR